MTKSQHLLFVEWLRRYSIEVKKLQSNKSVEQQRIVKHFAHHISQSVKNVDFIDLHCFFDIVAGCFECLATCPEKEETYRKMSKIADEIINDKFVPQKEFEADYSDCHGY